MNKYNIKPLDFVKAKPFTEQNVKLTIDTKFDCVTSHEFVNVEKNPNSVGIVTEINGSGCLSVEWIGENKDNLKNAWWEQEDLIKIDNLPNILARNMAHPFGNGKNEVDKYY